MTEQPITTYQQACRFLDDLQMHKIKLGLEAMQDILAEIGSPELRCPAVQVAGTNGKGSVCTMLRCILSAAGYRTGLYTSPHLSSVRERFRIDDRFISKQDFTRLLERIRVGLGRRKITYFECATALAFSWFAENDCDIVILETGMGGRLDATNVVVPLVSVITTVSFDHEQYLGGTIEQIAFEKAGIIKPGVPVVSGVSDPVARQVIEQTCTERQAPLSVLGSDFMAVNGDNQCWSWRRTGDTLTIDGLSASKNGVWQLDNNACAVATAVTLRGAGFSISDKSIRYGIGAAFWPGRMEYLELPSGVSMARHDNRVGGSSCVRFLLDGAHNQAGVDCLMAAVKQQFSYDRMIVVWASMADKNYCANLNAVAGYVDILLLTRPDTERAAEPAMLARCLDKNCRAQVECLRTVRAALDRATALASPDDLVVVAGSLYLIGEVRPLLVGEVVGND